jgi:cytochrome c peroxidase
MHPSGLLLPTRGQRFQRRAGGGLRWWLLGLLGLLGWLTGCGGGAASSSAVAVEPELMSPSAQLGQLIFRDTSLSASGRQACISCHDPAAGHASANRLAVQLGGAAMDLEGSRNAPSIRYLNTNQAFRFAADGTPTGGFFWDGRATSLAAQAAGPFLNPVEMANASAAEVVARLARASYAPQFSALYGADIFSRPDDALARMTLALQAYQREDSDFHPFNSKYDAMLRGQAALSSAELRGLALFNAPGKGNCAACHPSAKGSDGSFPLFTDFSYDNLGVPRNRALAQNNDAGFFDLGLCGRAELATRSDLCGAFKVPSLRNVALRGAFFHNGRFGTLKEALTFYVQRDTAPEKWYPLRADGTVDKFDDLPLALHGNVNTSEAPYNRRPGDAPALSDAEIDDVIAFLATLTDGWTAP